MTNFIDFSLSDEFPPVARTIDSTELKHTLVSHVYAIKGRTDFTEAERIHKNCKRLNIPFTWADNIPRSRANGEIKLEQERGILILLDRRSPYIEKFKHPKGLCYPFFKFTTYNNCNYWCEYCYLFMTFYMRPQSIHYVNYDAMFKEIDEFAGARVKKKFQVLNLGELGDPLAVDDVTGFSERVIPYVAGKENVKLLFLTKSTNVNNLLRLIHNNRTILSWSINCDLIAEKLEHRVPTPTDRIRSAAKAQEAGYEIRFRIDPLFWFDGWQEQYAKLIDQMASYTNPSVITLGAYRPTSGLINHIKARFPQSNLIKLEEKLVMDAGKKRFTDEKRIEMYRFMTDRIREKLGDVKISLCKEPINIWKKSNLSTAGMTCNCTD